METENYDSNTITGKFFTLKNIIIAILAILTGINTYTSTKNKNDLEIATMRIDTAQRKLNLQSTELDNIIKRREFDNNLKMEMYKETKDAIGKDSLTQNATLVILNEMLADDSAFRWKLKSILSQSPSLKAQAVIQKKLDVFSYQQSSLVKSKFTIDVFYLEELVKEALPRAKRIVEVLKQKFPSYNVRLRVLPTAVNIQSGYRIDANKIRYEKSETAIAKQVRDIIIASRVLQIEQPQMNMIRYSTPNYISVFVRNM